MTPDPIALAAGLNQNCLLYTGEDKIISIDMTGYDLATVKSYEWWVAKSPYSFDDEPGEVLIKKNKDDGIAVNGTKLDITIDAIDTVVKDDLYYHELKVVLADDSIKVAMTGNIVIRRAIDMGGAIP